MKQHMSYSWKGVLVALVVLVLLGSATQASGAEPEPQEVTLSASVREPAGSTGTFDFTFALHADDADDADDADSHG